MSDVQITGNELLDILAKKVVEDYGGKISGKWIEQDNESKQLSAIFEIEDKIGHVRVFVNAEIDE